MKEIEKMTIADKHTELLLRKWRNYERIAKENNKKHFVFACLHSIFSFFFFGLEVYDLHSSFQFHCYYLLLLFGNEMLNVIATA